MSTKPNVFVTGANKGIGLAIARQLGARGYSVWLGCRDQQRGDKAAAELRDVGLDARAVLLDVTDANSVRTAASRLVGEITALDVLVNNAGIAIGGPPPQVTEESVDDMRAMFEVNAFGPVRVTQAFLPLLRKSSAPRVIMMSSGLGSLADTGDVSSVIWPVGAAGYSASKSALNMFTVKFAKALLADGIKVNAVDPGYTATDLNGHSGPRTVEEAAVAAVELATSDAMGPTGGFFHDGHARRLARYPW